MKTTREAITLVQQYRKMTRTDQLAAERIVDSLISDRIEVHKNEYSALVAFVLTTVKGSLAKSALLKHFNSGTLTGKLQAADEFLKWNRRGQNKNYYKKLRIEQRKLFLKFSVVGGKDGPQL